MNILVVSSAPLVLQNDRFAAYAPYVDELKIWNSTKYFKIYFSCPIWKSSRGILVKNIDFEINTEYSLIDFDFTSFKKSIVSIPKVLRNLAVIFKAMQGADHIHIRCPGNVGLLGCLVQIFFPYTPKTAKYAGNWDPKAKQPWSYKLQKWILSNTYLTKNMQVLVYGVWPNQSKNIKPFFTATYFEHEKEPLYIRNYKGLLKFCFIGSLSPGKQPALAFELVKQLRAKGTEAELHIYGNGVLFDSLQTKVKEQEAKDWVKFHGNQPKEVVRKVLQHSHFLVLPSKSEGWPKVVAEAMFWGCIPIVTPISCVPWMLDHGKRGILMNDENLNSTIERLKDLILNPEELEHMSTKAALWSREYTLDKFQEEIAKLIHDQ